MTHMVMEVSSQAFKMPRLWSSFQCWYFLKYCPDHIGKNEHPTFEDYIQHKMMLFDHSEQVGLNVMHHLGIDEHAELTVPRDGIWLYGQEDADSPKADVYFEATDANLHGSVFKVREVGQQAEHLHINGEYTLDMPGDFNQSNALAAMIATRLVNADAPAMAEGLETVKVPGRMQVLNTKEHGTIYVDYAHNYASIAALLQFVRQNESVNQLTIVVGAPGNKGVSRRPGIGKAVSEGADVVYLTSDDPQYEDPAKIADEIQTAITNPKVTIYRELDRTKAIASAIQAAGSDDVVVLAAKGLDEYQKIDGVDTPYENDWAVANRIVSELEF